ncbi:MAG: xanthine dehydrogenase [Caulobacteraceae bacterium]|nr:xanthine dehydrogenase [Caulobacteraceae bacterium]
MPLTLPEWPDFGLSDDIRATLKAALEAGKPAALVTLYAVEGGGPRPPGTQMLFAEDLASGFLSGGCVEGDVAGHAARTLEDGEPRWLVYGEGGPWPDIRLLCGARIELLVEKIEPDDEAARELLRLWDARRPATWSTDGRDRSCTEAAPDAPFCAVDQPFRLQRRHDPTPRLAVVGSDPTALAIASLGAIAGMQTTLIRPKGPETPPPIPGVAYQRSEPAASLAQVGIDPWTAVAIATHDSDTDHEALLAALPSDAGYIGLLGARRRIPERLHRLRAAGITEDQLARLHAPIGLDLGGKSPWEVAVAVIGQMVAERFA